MKILYYSGTGNSLYVAKRLSEDRLSIPQALKDSRFSFAEEEIGIVCPLYCHMPPKTVQTFLEKASLQARYLFVIFTYGNRKCDGFEWMADFARKHHFRVDYIDGVKMVDNYLPSFDMAEQMAMDKNIEGQITTILENVKAKKKGFEKTTQEEKEHHLKIMDMMAQSPELFDGSQLFCTGDCTGCGICTKVCPLGKYTLKDGKALRESGSCDYCQACAQNCPARAIVPGKTDRNPQARFRNEHVSLEELMVANCQK